MIFHLHNRKTKQLSCVLHARTYREALDGKSMLDPRNLCFWVLQ